MTDLRVAVIAPVLGRPQNAGPLAESLAQSTQRAELCFVVSEQDSDEQFEACVATGARVVTLSEPPGPGDYARKIQAGYDATTQALVLLASDDLRFGAGWLEAVLWAARTYDVGVIGTNDLGNHLVVVGTHATHPVVRRCYIDTYGGVVGHPGLVYWPGYDHSYVDNELVGTATARGCYMPCVEAIVEHMHPFWGKGADDATYKRGRMKSAQDMRLFKSREHLWLNERKAVASGDAR